MRNLTLRLTALLTLTALFAALPLLAQDSGSASLTLSHDDVVTVAAWNTAETLILTASEDETIRLWDATSGTVVRVIQDAGPVSGAQWHSADARILSWTGAGTVTVWEASSGQALARFADADGAAINGAAFFNSDDTAESAVLAWGESGMVYGWQIADEAVLFEVAHPNPVLQASLNDTYLLTFEYGGIAHIYDVATLKEDRALQFDDETLGIDWALPEGRVLTWGGVGAAQVWQIDQNQQTVHRTLNHSRTFVMGARWSADFSQVLSWGADETVRTWDVSSGENNFTGQHEDWVTGATWNADRSRVLSWSFNGLYLWDAESGRVLDRWQHDSLVAGARFSADESQVLSWSWDGTARVWPVSP
ncbi:MAG: WD40 repeat domain-containing protein [Chloroflexota bacterium]